MAEQFVLLIRDVTLKTEVEAAVSESRSNKNGLSSEELVVEELEAHLLEILNEYRRRKVVQSAISGLEEETSLA